MFYMVIKHGSVTFFVATFSLVLTPKSRDFHQYSLTMYLVTSEGIFSIPDNFEKATKVKSFN